MVLDPAPRFANLLLHYYESRWIHQLRVSDIKRARRFVNVFWFIDDLTAINDGGEFERMSKDIYSQKGEYRLFRDLEIKIVHKKFNIQNYDKRDDFAFFIVRMPHLTSNIPSEMFYSAFGTEILQTARATSKLKRFYKTSENSIPRMTKQGGDIDVFTRTLTKTHGRYFQAFRKFYHTSKEFVNPLIK